MKTNPTANQPEDIWLACQLYTRYCEAVGGKAFNGDKLPTWDEFHSNPSKATQAKAWIEVAIQARKMT
jgi:hypothetical protein